MRISLIAAWLCCFFTSPPAFKVAHFLKTFKFFKYFCPSVSNPPLMWTDANRGLSLPTENCWLLYADFCTSLLASQYDVSSCACSQTHWQIITCVHWVCLSSTVDFIKVYVGTLTGYSDWWLSCAFSVVRAQKTFLAHQIHCSRNTPLFETELANFDINNK